MTRTTREDRPGVLARYQWRVPVRASRWSTPRAVVVVAIAALVLYLLAQGSYSLAILGSTVAIYAIVAQGLDFQYGTAGQLSVAQGGIWGMGAYLCIYVGDTLGLGFWVGALAGAAGGGLVAVLISLASGRVTGHYFVILTFAFASIANITFDNAIGFTGGPQGASVSFHPSLFGLPLDSQLAELGLSVVVFVVLAVVAYLLRSSSLGKRLFAAQQSEELAYSLGIRIRRDRMIAFLVAGVYAGVAGGLYALVLAYVTPTTFSVWAGINFVLMTMLGGVRVLLGPLIGAAFAVLFPYYANVHPPVDQVLYGVVLVVIVLLMPSGIGGGLVLAWRKVFPAGPRASVTASTGQPAGGEADGGGPPVGQERLADQIDTSPDRV